MTNFMKIILVVVAGIAGILAIIFSEKYLDFSAKKELFKSNVAYNFSCVCGIVAVLSILILVILG